MTEDTGKDWLTQFPLPMLPDSWDLNPIFLRKIEEMSILWDEFGYEWKLGCELEFELLTPEEAAKRTKGIIDDNDLSALHPEYRLLDESRSGALASGDTPGMMAYALEQIRQKFSANPDTERLLRESNWTHPAALEHLAEIEINLSSDDEKISHRARQNVFLAYIHTHNFAEGGVMDLVEARFGDYEQGLGWYDCGGPEIRTGILSSPLKLIESYHKFLHVLAGQVPRFGLALSLTRSSPPQTHLSLWRKSNNKNMMKMDDEESIVFCEKVLSGYYELLNSAPFLIQDKDYRQDQIRLEFQAGSRREDYIRQERDNWELRRGQYHGITHLARHLMAVMMGMAYGVMYEAEYDKFSRKQYFLELARKQHPVVRHKFGAYISGLANVLEHCSIDDAGYLHPDRNSVLNYMSRMQEEIGYGNLDQFAVCSDKDSDLRFNLRHDSAWIALFESIRITENNEMDLSFLKNDSEIEEAFSAVEITGRRTVLKTANDHLSTEAHSTRTTLKKFIRTPEARIFFTPYEQSELIRHYSRQSADIMWENAGQLLASFEDVRNNPQNQKHPESVFTEWFIEDKIIKPTENMDVNQTVLMQLGAHIATKSKWDRDDVLDWDSYIVAMRPHFKDVVEARIEALSRDPARTSSIESLKACLARVSNKPFVLQDAIWARVEGLFITLADGRMLNETGISDDAIQALRHAPAISIMKPVGLAYRDNLFSDKQIVEELDILFHEAPSKIERMERELDIANKSETVRLLFRMCGKCFVDSLADVRNWACTTLGTGLHNQLAGPDQNFENSHQKTGPEHMPGPV